MTKSSELYRSYSGYLMETFREKVYKIPISISGTCPNRDGHLGFGGCIFCGEEGAGHETLSNDIPPREQFVRNSEYISKRYKANKFIPYFQDFTNTYMPIEDFRKSISQVCLENVVGIAVSTRPDCINEDYLSVLAEIERTHNVKIYIELGLQSVNYKTLKKINRGHTLAEFIDGVLMIKKYGFEICAHVILNLPWDDIEDCIECAKILSALKVDGVKLHALYIDKGTRMAELFESGDISMIDLEEYVDRVVEFLAYLSPDIVIQRLVGRAPEKNTLFVNWNRSWWIIRDMIEDEMKNKGLIQGSKWDYLGGKAIR